MFFSFANDKNKLRKTFMSKTYLTKEEALAAFKKAASVRNEWEEAIRKGATREELEKLGLKTVVINDN